MGRNERIRVERTVYGRDITAEILRMDYGMQVILTGGDLAHVGAVSICGNDGNMQTITLPGHKDAVVSEKWANRLYGKIQEPVTVTAGIHYDHVSKEQIMQIVKATEQMLEEAVEMLQQYH